MDTNKGTQLGVNENTPDLPGMRYNWHTWPTHRIGETLYANMQGWLATEAKVPHVQRSTCFGLQESDLQGLKESMADWAFLRFHIGATISADQYSHIDQKPIFTLILEAVPKLVEERGQLYKLLWRPERLYQDTGELMAAEAIAAQTADLFRQSFCKLGSNEVGEVFEAAINKGVYRLNHFSFRSDNSDPRHGNNESSIEEQVKTKLAGADDLCIYLGESAPMPPGHPYRFRPILTLGKTPQPVQNEKQPEPNTDYPANFEFSVHCPPIC